MKKFKLLLALFFAFAVVAAAAFTVPPPGFQKVYAESYQGTGPNPDRCENEYIYYSRKESSFYYFEMPDYTNTNTNNSICGPVSGAIVTGYYAYYYPALVPGWQTYYISSGNVYYHSWSVQVDLLIDNLTTAMRASSGVTVDNYKKGLSDYFRLVAGVTVYYNRLLQGGGGGVHWASCVSELNALRPIALFLSYYNLSEVGAVSTGEDKLHSCVYINNHVMTADGYQTVKYYEMQSGVETLFRTDYYLWVETGWHTWGKVYLGRNFTVNDAYGIGAY